MNPGIMVSIKYPKGRFTIAQQIEPVVAQRYPFFQVVRRRLSDKRGVHSREVVVCIKHTHGLQQTVTQIVPLLQQIDQSVVVKTVQAF